MYIIQTIKGQFECSGNIDIRANIVALNHKNGLKRWPSLYKSLSQKQPDYVHFRT